MDELGVETVGQGAFLTYFQVAPPGLQKGSECGLDLMAGKACGRDGVTQGNTASGFSEGTKNWPDGGTGIGGCCNLSIHSEEIPSATLGRSTPQGPKGPLHPRTLSRRKEAKVT